MTAIQDRPTVHERLLTAFNATDLSVDGDRRTDADFLMAMGLAERHAGGVASSSAMRLAFANTVTEARQAWAVVRRLVAHMRARERWSLGGSALLEVADQVTLHHLRPACPSCHGRCFELTPGTPMLGNRSCSHCGGTGRRRVQKRHRTEITAVLARLERIDSLTEAEVRKLLRSQ